MNDLNAMLNKLKDRAEEAFEHYAGKEHWEPQDVKCAKETAELYDLVQTIQMNTGVWEEMKRSGDYSFGRYPHVSYGRDSRGRYTSRGDVYYDDRWHGRSYGEPEHNDDMHHEAIERLEDLMRNAKTEHERNEVMQMIKAVENQKR